MGAGLSQGPTPYGDRPIVRLADHHGEEHSLWLLHTTLSLAEDEDAD